MAKRLQEVASTSGAKAADAEYLAADLETAEASKLIVVVVSQAADDVQITFDSGSTWADLTAATTALTYTEFTVHTADDDAVNFRSNDVGGITLDIFKVYKVTTD